MTHFVIYLDSIDINLRLVLDLLIVVAYGLTVYFAGQGLKTWRDEVRARADMDLRRRLIGAHGQVQITKAKAEHLGSYYKNSYLQKSAGTKKVAYETVIEKDLSKAFDDLSVALLSFQTFLNEVVLTDMADEEDNKQINAWVSKQADFLKALSDLMIEMQDDVLTHPNQPPQLSPSRAAFGDKASNRKANMVSAIMFRSWLDKVFSHLPRTKKKKKT